MWKHKDLDSKLELGIQPKYLIVPRDLKALGQRIVESELLQGSANNDINPVRNAVEIMVSPFLRGDANNWYLLADPKMWDGIEIGFVQGKESPTIITAKSETDAVMFTNDLIQYKVRHEYGGAVVDYRSMYMGIPT
jgi:hypothetical protein